MLPAGLAEIAPWRTPRAAWPGALDGIRARGSAGVLVGIPWARHMPAPGAARWGRADPQLDLPGFLRLCAARDLAVVLAPVLPPGADAYPAWLGGDPAVQAVSAAVTPTRGPDGTTLPSYAAEGFYRRLGEWLAALATQIRPFLAPRGPIVALQIDAEVIHGPADPFGADYHPGALALYRGWLGDPAAEPPRRADPADLPRLFGWLHFREWLLGYALGHVAALCHDAGLDAVPLTARLPAGTPAGALTAAEQVVDVAMLDLGAAPAGYGTVRDAARTAHAGSRAPAIFLPAGAAAADFLARAARMHGARTVGVAAGDATAPGVQAPAGRKWAPVLVLTVRDYRALEAAGLPDDPRPPAPRLPRGYVTPPASGPPRFRRAVVAEARAWHAAVEAALRAGGVTADLGDDGLPVEILQRYRLVVCPTFDFLDHATQEKLLGYVRRGGHLAYGPAEPYLDERLEPCRLLADALSPFANEPDDPGFAADLATELEIAGVVPAAHCDDPALDLAAHILPDRATVLFAANPTAAPRTATIAGLGDPADPATAQPGPGRRVMLAPSSIGIWHLV